MILNIQADVSVVSPHVQITGLLNSWETILIDQNLFFLGSYPPKLTNKGLWIQGLPICLKIMASFLVVINSTSQCFLWVQHLLKETALCLIAIPWHSPFIYRLRGGLFQT